MASSCSHQDPERRVVSASAHGVAKLRGLEQFYYQSEDQIINDPYATALGSEVGEEWILTAANAAIKGTPDENKPEAIEAFRLRLTNLLAIRTNRIDHSINTILSDPTSSVNQICVLGAGLDARPWRLKINANNLTTVKYFECDFQEIFDYKLSTLKNLNAVVQPPFVYQNVIMDLSLPTWPIVLEKAGFQKHQPVLWILEGLTMYLKHEEMNQLMTLINSLSVPNSHIILDAFHTQYQGLKHAAILFRHDNLSQYMATHDWQGTHTDYKQLGLQISRPNPTTPDGYNLFVGKKLPATRSSLPLTLATFSVIAMFGAAMYKYYS
jgi:methyltransferase (TIGR00027 family)